MKFVFVKYLASLVCLLTLFTSIAQSSTDVTETLPEGRWAGKAEQTTSGGEKSQMKVSAFVKQNSMTMELQSSDGFRAIAFDKYQFVKKGHFDWLNTRSEKVGECECVANSCVCKGETKTLKTKRKIEFTDSKLLIHERGSFEGGSYETVYDLDSTATW